jgi:hypothetical protein
MASENRISIHNYLIWQLMQLVHIVEEHMRPFFVRLTARAMGYRRRTRSDPSKRAFKVYYDYGMHI